MNPDQLKEQFKKIVHATELKDFQMSVEEFEKDDD